MAYTCCFKKKHTTVVEIMLVATKNFTFDILLVSYLLYTALTPPYQTLDTVSVIVVLGYAFAKFISKTKTNVVNGSTGSSEITVTSCNLQHNNEVTAACIRDIVSQDPDYIVTLETSDAMYARLREGMIDYVPAMRGEGRLGKLIHLWAHTRVSDNTDFTDVVPVGGQGDLFPAVCVRIKDSQVTLIGVHLTAPDKKAHLGAWSQSFTDLAEYTKKANENPILAGDFNATMEHSGMRKLNKILKDAASSCRVRDSRTWPTDGYIFKKLLPWAIMGIDHIMVCKSLTVAKYVEYNVDGSDHKAICARIRISNE